VGIKQQGQPLQNLLHLGDAQWGFGLLQGCRHNIIQAACNGTDACCNRGCWEGALERTGDTVSINQSVDQCTFPTLGTHLSSQQTVDGKLTFAKRMHS